MSLREFDSEMLMLGKRSLKYDWFVTDETDGVRKIVRIHISHDKQRKELYANISPITVEKSNGYVWERYEVFSGVTFAYTRLARYSDKALLEFRKKALEMLVSVNHPVVRELLATARAEN